MIFDQKICSLPRSRQNNGKVEGKLENKLDIIQNKIHCLLSDHVYNYDK